MQRIGLARAMYGDPVILVLDEPNSNLDNTGSEAVNHAIRGFKAADKVVVVVAHRPSIIKECDMILMLEQGNVRAFGPRDKVLREVLENHKDVVAPKVAGGVQ
jgi:ATP-binding cassette subfamily C protein